MKRMLQVLVLVAAFFLSACEVQDSYSGKVILDGEHTLAAGEIVPGELIVTGGRVRLEPGSEVAGSVMVLGGEVWAAGQIGGDATLLLGQLSLLPDASVGGDLAVGGGELERSPAARVHGEVNLSSAVHLPEVEGRRSFSNRLVSILIEGPAMALGGYLALRYLPGKVRNIQKAAFEHGIVSAALGLLAWVVGASLLVLMAFTIVLIPVSLVGFAGMLGATLYGSLPFGLLLGRSAARLGQWTLSPPQAAALGMFLLAAILQLAPLIPWIGSILPLVFLLTGFGAALLTRFGLYRFTPPVDAFEGA